MKTKQIDLSSSAEIMELWNEGKNALEISKLFHVSVLTIRCFIREQIGDKKYQERGKDNMRKAQQKRRLSK